MFSSGSQPVCDSSKSFHFTRQWVTDGPMRIARMHSISNSWCFCLLAVAVSGEAMAGCVMNELRFAFANQLYPRAHPCTGAFHSCAICALSPANESNRMVVDKNVG